ncbi:hypothetical protein ACFY8O_30000 [Streptomyces argenteolus]|uniref:Heme oxygenase-like protein n=1 Tax=Streptomyces argenteolus TaxID=67274 RepID=A0ABW6XEH3_9ACTN
MLAVIAAINKRKKGLAQHPFLASLTNAGIDSRRRMAFAPCLAPFVLGFADINTMGLRNDAVKDDDRLQALVNGHTREDDHHWGMYLDDLETLGYNRPARPTETIRFLWGDHCRDTRRLTYRLFALAEQATPPLRIALVEAVEATGFIAWRAFLKASEAYTADTGNVLRYFGPEHAALETGHAVGADDIDNELRDIDLGAQRPTALAMVDEVFDLFVSMLDEQLAYARHQVLQG